jgi:hypothetical protein
MRVIRKQTIDTEIFELGDEIRFKLTTGEKVRAKAVQECEKGMLFITKDCIGEEKPMYNGAPEGHLDYVHSDLRKYLNCELLSLFPEKIKRRMVPMPIEGCLGDYIRIPTKEEIFGTNQFYGMNHRRNRIAFEHTNGEDVLEWYWLQDNDSGAAFANVNDDGNADYDYASGSRGVRAVFMLKQKNNQ